MSKELEALEEIKTLRGFNQVELNNDKNINKSLDVIEQAIEELDKFKALLNKYEIKDIETLEEIIKDYDDMAKSLVEHVLGIEIEVKS